MNRRYIFLIAALLFILIIKPALAITISPGRVEYAFEPNLKVTESACVSYDYANTLEISVSGGLAKYITLDKEVLVFEGPSRKCVSYTALLPSTLTPGRNEARITASEVPSPDKGGFAALASVGQQFRVTVPYPGKYLTATLQATDVEAEKPVEFIVNLKSRGDEIISKVSADIEIINQNNKSLGVLETTEINNFEPGTKNSLRAVWSPSSRDVGTYDAIATVSYDDNFANAETSFRIGELNLKLINVTSTPIEKDEIGRIDTWVESFWISQIEDVTAEVKAAGRTVKSESIIIEPWSKKLIPVYFPTEGLEAGEYPATVTVRYADKTLEESFTLVIFEDKNMFYFMAGTSAALIIIIALMIIFFMKQREFKRKMQYAMYNP